MSVYTCFKPVDLAPCSCPWGWPVMWLLSLIQVLFTSTAGMVLWLTHVRRHAVFSARQRALPFTVSFGWIYYATPFELWAYATES